MTRLTLTYSVLGRFGGGAVSSTSACEPGLAVAVVGGAPPCRPACVNAHYVSTLNVRPTLFELTFTAREGPGEAVSGLVRDRGRFEVPTSASVEGVGFLGGMTSP
jgi:hypothetical protein